MAADDTILNQNHCNSIHGSRAIDLEDTDDINQITENETRLSGKEMPRRTA